jgi:hypothetical protein
MKKMKFFLHAKAHIFGCGKKRLFEKQKAHFLHYKDGLSACLAQRGQSTPVLYSKK